VSKEVARPNDETKAAFADLWAKNRQGEIVVAPCLSLAIYLDETDPAQVLGFYQRATDALEPHLTHYLAERMRRPAKITPRASGMVPAWFKRPSDSHEYKISFCGGEVTDVSPWNIEVVLNYIPHDPARLARYPGFLRDWEKKVAGGQAEIPCTVLRVCVPIDAELAKPEVWVPWVLGIDLLRAGTFMLGESGYSLCIRDDADAYNVAYAYCSRYPGLDWYSPSHGKFLRRYEQSLQAVLPQVKRTAWMTFLNEVPVKVLGGLDRIRAELADDERIVLHPLEHGLCIQAGTGPELGDLSRHQISSVQRRVARVLRPVRLKGVPKAYYEDFVEHWFNMFDDENPRLPGADDGAPKT
jgi:hypothetical protein